MLLILIASSNTMILATPRCHTAIICAKKSFNTIKNCKKVEIVYDATSSYMLTFTNNITYLA